MNLPEWIPTGLRDPRRLIPAAVAFVVLVGAAIYLPSRSGDERGPASQVTREDGSRRGDGAEEDLDLELGEEGEVGGSERGGRAGRRGRANVSTRAGGGGATGGGAGGGSGGTVNRNSYQGVTDREVKLVVAYQHEPCGQDPSAIIAKALPNEDPEASIATAMEWFNEDPKRALRGEVPEEVLNGLGSGYYGRRVNHVVVDDRGDFCPEQSRNDAKTALSRHNPFAVVGGGNEWDDEVSAQRVIKVTGRAALDDYFLGRRPFLWGPITGASDINFFLSGYTARYLHGKRSVNTGDVRTANKTRKFGIVYLDNDETRKIVQDLRSRLARRGVEISDRAVIGYEPNLATIGVQARNIVAQLIAEEVTSILMVMDPIAVQFISQAADNQEWYPEWISNTYGLMDWSLGPRSFMSRPQASNTFGISVYWPSKQIREEDTEEYKVWRAKHPDRDPPSDWLLWYRSFKLVFRGIALAGPELTPHSFEAGYNWHCAPCGRSEGFLPLIGYAERDFTAVDDAHRQRYDPNAPDYAAAKEHWSDGQPPRGAYVYEDGGKRYTTFD